MSSKSFDETEASQPSENEATELLSQPPPPANPGGSPNSANILKTAALVALVIQNSGLAVAMRYTFILAQTTGVKYIPSTAVFHAEILKLVISTACCFLYDCQKSPDKFVHLLYTEMYLNYRDFLRLMVPSMLYTLQNSLQYFSMSCLSAPVFQVLYQMKIITTALFSVALLAKRLSALQWAAIVALTVGVALVQLSQTSGTGEAKGNSLAGLVSVVLGCLTSGFAGVYFELVLKSTAASIWLRNIQLSLIGIAMSLVSTSIPLSSSALLTSPPLLPSLLQLSCYFRDYEEIAFRGFLAGYNHWVWSVIFLQVAPPLLFLPLLLLTLPPFPRLQAACWWRLW